MNKVHGYALIILVLSLLGCTRRADPAEKAAPPIVAPAAAPGREAPPAAAAAMKSPPPEARKTEAAGEDLVIPSGGGVPRYPEDFAIGRLGRDDASAAAYRFAWSVVAGLAEGAGTAVPDVDIPRLAGIRARYYRLGSGTTDGEGRASFLFRLIGPELSVAGELHLQAQDDQWAVRDLVLEDIVRNTDADGGNAFDPLIYKRFL